MRIKQCNMLNDSMYTRFSYFFKKHSLKKYYNPNKPAIFFSLWGMMALKHHRSFALIIWRGSDIVKMDKKLHTIKKRKNTYHIAISSYISEDLKRHGIEHKFIPVVGADMKYFKPCLMGNEIYTYIPNNSDKYYKRYGKRIVNLIKERTKYKINIIPSNKYKRKKLVDVYKKCFCGLRLTKHDGMPSQVIEMGLMGIRSFYNGNIPGSIRWDERNIEEIIENIKKESEKINTINYEYANQIRNFINIDRKWLDTDFWKEN